MAAHQVGSDLDERTADVGEDAAHLGVGRPRRDEHDSKEPARPSAGHRHIVRVHHHREKPRLTGSQRDRIAGYDKHLAANLNRTSVLPHPRPEPQLRRRRREPGEQLRQEPDRDLPALEKRGSRTRIAHLK